MEQLFGAIPTVLSGLDPNVEVDDALVFAAWGRCAGDLLRQRTVALQFFENRLIIAVEDETWRRHLVDLSPQMLAKLNLSLGQGKVRFIEFRVDAATVKAVRKRKEGVGKEMGREIAPALAKAAEAIADDELRKQFLSAASLYLEKQKRSGKKD
jgi:hypothetical protein